MRVLVTGAGGQLGTRHGRWPARPPATTSSRVDHADARRHRPRRGARRRSRRCGPTPSSTARAWTAVDACEGDPERAFAPTRWRCAGSPRRAAGSAPTSCTSPPTTSSTAPSRRPTTSGTHRTRSRSTARSKLAGEREALGARHRHAAVVRTSWVCGEHGANMVKTDPAPRRPSATTLSFVDDQSGHPTFTADLAPMLRRLALDRRGGVHPRDQPGRGELVRVRPDGRRARWASDPDDGAPDRDGRTAAAAARPRARPTACSTTPSCGRSGCRCCQTIASRWSSSSPVWCDGNRGHRRLACSAIGAGHRRDLVDLRGVEAGHLAERARQADRTRRGPRRADRRS